MRILFMGTPDFARSILEKLHNDGENIVAVVTQPDKPQGRKMILTPPPVKQYALANGISACYAEGWGVRRGVIPH